MLPVSECDMNLTTVQKGILCAVGFAGHHQIVHFKNVVELIKNQNL